MGEMVSKNGADTQAPNTNQSDKKKFLSQVCIENTCILDCLEVVQNEYDIERNKRQSFETRSGIVVTILAALCIFVFEKVNIPEILTLLTEPCTFLLALKILSGVAVYLGFIVSLVFAIKTVNVKEFDNFDVTQIKESLMGTPRIEGVIRLTMAYREIIIQHRNVNKKNADSLKRALIWVFVTFTSLVIYINL